MALVLKSQRQIKADILNAWIASLGLTDVNEGSVEDILSTAIAREAFAQYIQMAKITRLVNLDAITGTDLDNKAFEYGITRNSATSATGTIDILRPSTFTKVSTSFYAGTVAPIIGNTTIDVNNASDALYGSSGTLILGRGTDNEEEVTYAVPPVDNTNYWTFTISALTKNHAVEETVILKQGSDESISAGTLVIVPATSTSGEISFTIVTDQTLLAGEDKVQDVDVVCTEAGTDGNIASYAITGETAFSTSPFTGARAENTSKYTTGTDLETDDELRDRIKDHIQSLPKGTKQAILTEIVGLVDPETAKRVVSANLVEPQNTNTPVKIYIDDSTGFEPSFSSKGFETILNGATGGETRLQIDNEPLVKAQLETNNAEKYDMSGGSKTLICRIGITEETITFDLADFSFPDFATAEEIVTAINDKSTLFEARTSQTGTKVVITSRSDTNENIQVLGGTANSILGFPTDEKFTSYLYIDDVLQSKDGVTASIVSGNSATYNFIGIGAFPHTLTIVVDGKTTNTQTVTFQASDFVDTSACTVAEIIAVINAQLAGAQAIAFNNSTQVKVISNTETSSSSKIRITGGTANDATNGLNFDTTEVSGSDSDYTLNNSTGTIELTSPLTANQVVSLGSQHTRAYLRAGDAQNYAPNNGETLVFSVDGGGNQTVTFDTSFTGGKSATDTATFINIQLNGATAYARTYGGSTYLEVKTNSFDQTVGSIEIKSSSTANSSFSFTLDTEAENLLPHKAFIESVSTGPYAFVEGATLVVVVDSDIVNNTYSVVFDYDGTATSGTSTTIFEASAFSTVFDVDDVLNDFYVAFVSGANTSSISSNVTTVANTVGDTYRYTFGGALPNYANFAAGDIIRLSGMQNSENDGNFILTGIDSGAGLWIEITNTEGVAESGSTGSCLVGQRRQITDYTTLTGTITVGSAFTNTPVATETFIVLPSTVPNVVDFLNNTRVTSLSLKADCLGSTNNTKIQISSLSEGSDGYIQVTGGAANDVLNFSTTEVPGLEAYNYYTGLLALVHKTIYGDDTDLVSFPGVGAAGIKFIVSAPTITQISVSVTLTLNENITISQVSNDVNSAITGYINSLGVGEDVIIEEIRCAIKRIDGIYDVVLNTPTANIAIADNEQAKIRPSEITIG